MLVSTTMSGKTDTVNCHTNTTTCSCHFLVSGSKDSMKIQSLSLESSINKEVGNHQDLNIQNPTLYFLSLLFSKRENEIKYTNIYFFLPFHNARKTLSYLYLSTKRVWEGRALLSYVMYSDQSSHYRKVCTFQFKTCWLKFKECHHHNYSKLGFSCYKYQGHNYTYQIGCLKRYAHAEAHKSSFYL